MQRRLEPPPPRATLPEGAGDRLRQGGCPAWTPRPALYAQEAFHRPPDPISSGRLGIAALTSQVKAHLLDW